MTAVTTARPRRRRGGRGENARNDQTAGRGGASAPSRRGRSGELAPEEAAWGTAAGREPPSRPRGRASRRRSSERRGREGKRPRRGRQPGSARTRISGTRAEAGKGGARRPNPDRVAQPLRRERDGRGRAARLRGRAGPTRDEGPCRSRTELAVAIRKVRRTSSAGRHVFEEDLREAVAPPTLRMSRGEPRATSWPRRGDGVEPAPPRPGAGES